MSDAEVAIYQPQAPGDILSDDEIRRLYRMGEALAKGGMFKEVRQAEQAFSKMLIGHYLGLNPAQSMLNLHLVRGNVQFAYPFFAQLIRSHAGYDYKILEHTPEKAEIEFFRGGESLGTVTFTMEDAEKAGLVKDDGAWKTYPENMLVARALSKGTRFFMGEVMGGIPVYVLGETPPEPEGLTAGEGDGSAPGIDLGPKVEAVLERAASLGVEALAHRPTIEMQLGKRSPDVVNAWVRNATKQLDAVEEAAIKEEEVQDAEVVEEEAEQARAVRPPESEPTSSDDDNDDSGPPATESSAAPPAGSLLEEQELDQEVLRRQLEHLMYRRDHESFSEEKFEMLMEEIDKIEDGLRRAGAEVPGQEKML
jgi:hypothetical protein